MPFTTAVVGLTAVGRRGFVSFADPHRLVDADGNPLDWLDEGWARLACVLSVRRWYTQSLDRELLDVDLLVAQLQVGIPSSEERLAPAAGKLLAVAQGLRTDLSPSLAAELARSMEVVGQGLPPGHLLRHALRREWAKLGGHFDRTMSEALVRWGASHLVDVPEAALDVELVDPRLLPAAVVGVRRSVYDATLTLRRSDGAVVVSTMSHPDLPIEEVAGVQAVYVEHEGGRQWSAPIVNNGLTMTASFSMPDEPRSGSVELRASGCPTPAHPARERRHRTEADLRYIQGFSLGRAAATIESLMESLPEGNPLTSAAMRELEAAAALCQISGRADQADEIESFGDGVGQAGGSAADRPTLAEGVAVERFARERRDDL